MTPNMQGNPTIPVQPRSFIRRAIGRVAWLIAVAVGVPGLVCMAIAFLAFFGNPASDAGDIDGGKWLAWGIILGIIGLPFGWLADWGIGDE
mgnify:CR=1 FL=1